MAATALQTLDGREVALDDAGIGRLESRLRGRLVRAGDPAADAVRRVWNGMIDRTSSRRFALPPSTSFRWRFAVAGTESPAMPSRTVRS
jgi:hypothetical protein